MAIKLKKIQRKSPLNQQLSRWYLTQASTGSTGLKEIAREIGGRSALSLGDVQSVLSNLMEVMPLFLKLGQSVKLEGLGTFRITVSSEGADSQEELNSRHLRGLKLVFLPSVEIKRSLESASFEISQ